MLPAPHIQAQLFLPRLQLHGLISFMIDSGADSTTLSLIDIERINVTYRRLRRNSTVRVQGSGGTQLCYTEEAILLLRDEDAKTYHFQIYVHIPQKGSERGECEQQRRLPSVLGRDVLNQCSLTTNFQQGIVELVPPEGTRLPVATRRLL